MEFRAVEYFLAVAEHGSLSGAAQRLGVTQPAVTKAIRRLEEDAGVPLFERFARGVRPTVYGRALLRHARNLRADLRAAVDEIEALRSGSSGHVRVGAGPSWQRSVLPEAITAFRRQRPGVYVEIVGGIDNTLKRQLRDGGLDFVLAALPDSGLPEPDLHGRPLLHDDYAVVAAASHPLRHRSEVELQDLLEFPWILPGPNSYLVEQLQIIFRGRGLPAPDPVIETDIVSLKLALMRASEFLSFHATAHLVDLAETEIVPLTVPGSVSRRAAGIIVRRGFERNPAAEELIAQIDRICGLRTARHGPSAKE
ncbi:MAG: LysR family transcriptional regulator [Pseudomonadota bacterium]